MSHYRRIMNERSESRAKRRPANTVPETRAEKLDKIRKFLRRAEASLTGPIYELRDMGDDKEPFEFKVFLSFDPKTGKQRVEWRLPEIHENEILVAITRMRVFILASEDNYLPKVVALLQSLFDDPMRSNLDHLRGYVDLRSTGEKLVGSYMSFGLSRPDADPGMDVMREDGELAMHYIYGYAVKEDDWRRQIIDHYGAESFEVKMAVHIQLSGLMRTVYVVRKQILLLLAEELGEPGFSPGSRARAHDVDRRTARD